MSESIFVGLKDFLSWKHSEEGYYEVYRAVPDAEPMPAVCSMFAYKEGLVCPPMERIAALRESLRRLHHSARKVGFAPTAEAAEVSERLAKMQLVNISIASRLADIEREKDQLIAVVAPAFLEKKFTSDERRKQERDKLIRERDFPVEAALCGEADALRTIKSEVVVVVDFLDRQFRLLRYDYEYKTVGHRSGRRPGGSDEQ
jgi:hypothetical protein